MAEPGRYGFKTHFTSRLGDASITIALICLWLGRMKDGDNVRNG